MGDLLYRVVDEESLVGFDPRNGFIAADTRTAFDPGDDPQSAQEIIELHSDWSNRTWTPLISMTDSEEHALHLACGREERGRTDVHVAIIDRDLLESQVEVYRMMDLVEFTDAEIAPEARSWNEHVCVHRIPRNTIVDFFTLSEFEAYLDSDDEHPPQWSSGEEGEEEEEDEEEEEEEEGRRWQFQGRRRW